MSDLKDKTVKSIIWFSIEKFGTQVIQLVLNIILARLLSPSDYGIVGMVLVFLTISTTIIESGFSQALIRKVNADNDDYDTVFLFNIISAGILFVILSIASPYIASFYGIAELETVMKVISLNLIIISFSLIQATILTKNINFKLQTKIALISILISSISSLIIALSGFGYWSLVFQMLIMNLIRTVLLWYYVRWKPRFLFKKESFKELFGFGSKLFFSSIIETTFQNIYTLIIGKLFSASILGLYSQAKKIQETPTSSLSQIIQKVTYPAYATIQDDNSRLKRGYRKSVILIMFVNVPLMFCLLTVSDSFIEVFLTHKWIDASIYMKLLCLMGIIFPLHPMNLNILKVKGRSDLFLSLQILKTIVGLILILLGLYWGIIGLIIGQVISTYLAYYINAYYSGKLIDYYFKEQVLDIMPYIIVSAVIFTFVYFIGFIVSNFLILLILQISIGMSFYLFVSKALKLKGYSELMLIYREYFSKN